MVADAASQRGDTVGAPAYWGSSVCSLPGCGGRGESPVWSGCPAALLVSVALFRNKSPPEPPRLFNEERGAFAGYSHLLSRRTLGNFSE